MSRDAAPRRTSRLSITTPAVQQSEFEVVQRDPSTPQLEHGDPHLRRSGTSDSLAAITSTPNLVRLPDIDVFPSPLAEWGDRAALDPLSLDSTGVRRPRGSVTALAESFQALGTGVSKSGSGAPSSPQASPLLKTTFGLGLTNAQRHAAVLGSGGSAPVSPRTTSSPLRPDRDGEGGSQVPSMPLVGAPRVPKEESLPASLVAKFQRHEADKRIVSEQVAAKPVEQYEVPALVRTRSSSNARLVPPVSLHREPSLASTISADTPIEHRSVQTVADQGVIYVRGRSRRLALRVLREIGTGTFSQVVLCSDVADDDALHAVKVVRMAIAGGADKDRVETTVRREIALLELLRHPLIIRLDLYEVDDDLARLVLRYCEGGDLFNLAAQHRNLMQPRLVRRIFAELVVALLYMHDACVVHRDIKLENVLLDVPAAVLERALAECEPDERFATADKDAAADHGAAPTNGARRKSQVTATDSTFTSKAIDDDQDTTRAPLTQAETSDSSTLFPKLLTCLTDLGLARRIDGSNPGGMTTRCGSEDYAAPEVVMGQAYDGRQTDAWALGAVLYCMLEGRLPFDLIPGLEHRVQTRVLHRICRIEWRFVRLREKNCYQGVWEGAKRIVNNLLRSRTKRWSVQDVANDPWLVDEVDLVRRLCGQVAAPHETLTTTDTP